MKEKRKVSKLGTLEELKLEHFGKRGTRKREELEEGYKNLRSACSFKKPDLEKA